MQAVTKIRMILVIIKHWKSYLETLITETWQQMRQKKKQDKYDGVFGALSAWSAKKKEYIE